MSLPAKFGFNGTRTRFDELQATHVMQAEEVHRVVYRVPHVPKMTLTKIVVIATGSVSSVSPPHDAYPRVLS